MYVFALYPFVSTKLFEKICRNFELPAPYGKIIFGIPMYITLFVSCRDYFVHFLRRFFLVSLAYTWNILLYKFFPFLMAISTVVAI